MAPRRFERKRFPANGANGEHGRRELIAALDDLEQSDQSELLRRKGAELDGPDGRAPRRLERRVRAATFEPDDRIDLHGHDRVSARRALAAFLRRQRAGACVLIVHGKGTGILAESIARWLEAAVEVAEHVVAPPRLGGDGARMARVRGRRHERTDHE
jgi:DNA-nicking Smr family endonuclease